MNTPAFAHIPYLDGWRGLAIVCVLIGHFSRMPMLGWLGGFGVALFFALSGRLMGELLFVKRVRFTDFFVRRATRVLPTFWVFIATVAAATLALPTWQAEAEELLSTLFFLRTYLVPGTDMLNTVWPIGHIWSLNVEEHTYVWLAMCAGLARALRIPAQWLLFATCALLLGFMVFYMGHPLEGATRWQVRTEVAAMGIVAAATLRCLPLVQRRLPWPLLAVACVLAAICSALYKHKGLQLWLTPLCLAFAVNYLHVLPEVLLRVLAARWLRWFGCCSFSIYLWQQPFFVAVNQGVLHPLPALLASLAVGALSFYVFEDPMRRYLNRKWAQRSQPARVAVIPEEVQAQSEPGR